LNAVDEGIALRCRCVKVKELWGLERKGKLLDHYVENGVEFKAQFRSREMAAACNKWLGLRSKTVRLS